MFIIGIRFCTLLIYNQIRFAVKLQVISGYVLMSMTFILLVTMATETGNMTRITVSKKTLTGMVMFCPKRLDHAVLKADYIKPRPRSGRK